MTAPFSYDVVDAGDAVEVHGYDAEEVAEALSVWEAVRRVQAAHCEETSSGLLQTMMAAGIPLMPPASLVQVQRKATLRRALLATGPWTVESLAQAREDSVETTRTWVIRRRKAARLFTVEEGGRLLIPGFLIDENGESRDVFAPVLGPLMEAGLDGWTIWTWMTRPTGFLSGDVPELVAVSNPDRAARAAAAFVGQFGQSSG